MIVPVTEENLMDAARVYAASWRESHREVCSPEYLAAQTVERQADYLRDEQRAGKGLWLLLDPEPAGVVSTWDSLIENLYVLPEKQGMGCGGQLLRFAAARCSRPALWVLSSNRSAFDWYVRKGFRPTGAVKPLAGGLFEQELAWLAEDLAFTEREREELARARTLPIVFDEDCPEITPEQALKFRRVNPVRRTAGNV